MPLPFTTTAAKIEIPNAGEDPYETTWTVLFPDLPGVVSGYSGRGSNNAGDQQVLSATWYSDDLIPFNARLTDLATGEVYQVDWVRQRYELGLGHCKAGLTLVTGAADS